MIRRLIAWKKGLTASTKELTTWKRKLMTVLKVSNKKLDIIYAQVAYNTEQEVKINEIAARVDQLETDVKLIKKLVSNQ